MARKPEKHRPPRRVEVEEIDEVDEIEEIEEEEEQDQRRSRREREGKAAKQKPAPGKQAQPVRRGPKSRNAIVRYFQETGDELRKVAWPSREEAVRLTLIVLGTTLAFAIFLGLLDLLFHRLASLLV